MARHSLSFAMRIIQFTFQIAFIKGSKVLLSNYFKKQKNEEMWLKW
jgi:hypothetical protein